MTTKECTTAELAKTLGVTVQRVTQLQAEGVFVRVGRNRYRLADCVQAYVHYREAAVRAELGGGTSLTSARTDWVQARARIAHVEYQARIGELVPVDEVARAWAAVVTTLRTRLLSVPSHISARCGAPDSQSRARVHEIAEQLIRNALEELSAVEIESIP
jgi:phage terminase Nu1 subunit (DNA packaging protein)